MPVQPGWYDSSALLGYVNPLRPEEYVRTPFLEFLLAAPLEPTKPFVVVLDEMNLSHPEQYLAPLLSAMETGDNLHLHAEDDRLDGVPGRIPYPANLVLIGTVNMDETTHGLSDKVLDRAFTLEFWQIDLARYPRWGQVGLAASVEAEARKVLEALMRALAPARMHFGWRLVDEVLGFVNQTQVQGDGFGVTAALDEAVHAKILPKLRGDDRPRFREALAATQKALTALGLQRCVHKVKGLQADLDATGSAHFWR